jgi:hypothetical protein
MTSDDLLARAKANGAPLIDGERVTFVWEGDEPELIGDLNHWSMGQPNVRFERAAPSLWTRTMTVPEDAYF